VDSHIPIETELIERIAWLIRLRWLAILGTGLALVLAWLLYPGQLALLPLAIVTLVILLYNTQFFFYARALEQSLAGKARLRHATRFAYVQIILDLLALAALIHFSGGAENPMAVFFVFHTIISSILLPRGISFVMATLAALLYAAIAGFEYAGILPHYHPPILEGVELYRLVPFLLVDVTVPAISLTIEIFSSDIFLFAIDEYFSYGIIKQFKKSRIGYTPIKIEQYSCQICNILNYSKLITAVL